MFFRKKNALFYLFAAVFLLYLVPVMLDNYPQRDVVMRYIPMAEAFARGDYEFAFHPGVQCLMPLTGGTIVRLTGCSGFTGVKLASLMFFAMGVFPLFAILRRIFTEKIALGGVVMYIFASKLTRIACSGLRDSLKILVILFLTMGLVMIWEKRERLGGYLWLGAGAGVAICARNDLILFASLALFAGAVLECRRSLFLRGTLAALLAAAVTGLPEFVINSHLTGMVVPGSRFVILFEKAFRTPPVWKSVFFTGLPVMAGAFLAAVYSCHFLLRRSWSRRLLYAGVPLVLLAAVAVTVSGDFLCDRELAVAYVESIAKGCGSIFIPFALLGIVLRIREKLWTTMETLVLFCFGVHQTAVLLQVIFFYRYLYVSDRYLWPAVPLILGWSSYGVYRLWQYGRSRMPAGTVRPVCIGLAVITAVAFYADTVKPMFRRYTNAREGRLRDGMEYFGDLIRRDYRGERYASSVPFELHSYRGNVRPFIYFDCESKLIVTAYYAGGLPVPDASDADYLLIPADRKVPGFEPLGEQRKFRRVVLQLYRKREVRSK